MSLEAVAPVPPMLTLSVVSHGQGSLVERFLGDLARGGLDCTYELVITLNMPEPEGFLRRWPELPIKVVRNPYPKGFGANHNAALGDSISEFVAVVNPDIRLTTNRLAPILDTLRQPGVGACGPAVYDPDGRLEDSARRFPTVVSLARKIVTGRSSPDYRWVDAPTEVDWLAGMFIVFPRQVFLAVQGFDERYFMYYEDADICRRLRRVGWSIWVAPRVVVIHAAQRRSHRDLRHLGWHVASATRFLLG